MARCELTIANPLTLDRRVESSEVVLAVDDGLVEYDAPLSEAERLDTEIRLILDGYYSVDGGATWVHRLRNHFQGGTFPDDANVEQTRLTPVTVNVPLGARVKLAADRVP